MPMPKPSSISTRPSVSSSAEFYIDKTVGIIICVVVGVLLMGIVYAFIKNNIQTRLDTEIGNLWDYTA